ncbi:hypothetical protein SASPL_120792 [Salvia splendens]|uniref:C2H2-type domain-containing protein n=1 Tax=Salvia splendens TaxID=180675 RepID=A0A8X8ZVL8_SALSN|nr:hypothetical protein SASPL_120792 [Salvia splendens]
MMKRSRDGDDFLAMDNCLMLLSGGGDSCSSRTFTCKTCNRKFPSFQALGGHRASHKKPRMEPPKPKTHECSICGQEFPLGQALGGHMRRHRVDQSPSPPLSLFPVVKKPNNRRVFSLDLNLTPLENHYFFIASSHI